MYPINPTQDVQKQESSVNVNYNFPQAADNNPHVIYPAPIPTISRTSTSTGNRFSRNYSQSSYGWPPPPPGTGGEYTPMYPIPTQEYFGGGPYQQAPPNCWNPQYSNPPTINPDWYVQNTPPIPVSTATTDSYTKYYNENASSPPVATTSSEYSDWLKRHGSTHDRKRTRECSRSDYSREPRPRSRDGNYSHSEAPRKSRRDSMRSRSIEAKSKHCTESHDRPKHHANHLKTHKPNLTPTSTSSHCHNNNSNGIATSSTNSKSSDNNGTRNYEDPIHRNSRRGHHNYNKTPMTEEHVRPRNTPDNKHHRSSHHYNTAHSYPSNQDRKYTESKKHSSHSTENSNSSGSGSRPTLSTRNVKTSYRHSSQNNHYSHSDSRNRSSYSHPSGSGSSSHNGGHDGRKPSYYKEEMDYNFAQDCMKDTDHADEDFDKTVHIEKWVRSAPAELYYTRDKNEMVATERTKQLCDKFENNLLERARNARKEAEKQGEDKMKQLIAKEAAEFGEEDSSTSDSDESSGEEEKASKPSRSTAANRELERRKLHPKRLHSELWHNDPGEMNDGPVCRCSAKAKRFGIRHGFYPGEDIIYKCNAFSNNPTLLHHYRITISPAKNFLVNSPTVINHDGHEYLFEGFSLFSHYELDLKLPPCKVIRFNIRYDVFVEAEPYAESFCVKELVLFETYLFREILELVDLKHDWDQSKGCSQFHLMPRFVRQLPDNGKEILSMNRVLLHLLKNGKELVREDDLSRLLQVDQKEWQSYADKHKGMIVTKWGMKPCALRADQIDRDITFGKDSPSNSEDGIPYPLIVHFGIRPPQLSYAGNSGYQRAWRRYVKYRHLLSNMPKPSIEEKRKLVAKDLKLRQMRTASTMKRDVTVDISAKAFRTTGICCDLVQHAMLIPVLVGHLRFHKSLVTLEKRLQYTFQNPYLLQLAMTHPSYRENFGTNPDHARNALTNCGIRQPEYGDRRIHYSSTRKRGINTLINIMARFGAEDETESEITHNERLEFLGDAVVEFATSIHLYHLFPDLEEGGLATYRAAIVQNQHLAELAHNLQLDQFMLYAHGSDLCHDSELRHAMANCFEALMGAIFLDGGIEVADRIFGRTLFETDSDLHDIWTNYPKHPLQVQEPKGDRHWIDSHGGVLKKLTEFEEIIGLEFTHIRLLARAFTDRSLGYNHLSRGSNQRLEFLGDTVLQLISSEYLYRHFPDHHEGHLSLLRSSLVNNRTQSLVCDDLGMTSYAMRGDPKLELKTKDRADLLEAFLGALYIDKGLKYCVVFCSVCFIPRLSTSIIKQEWNDPKSKLQQCCLTLRTMDGNEPDIPQYKITESKGPTNTRVYVVAVFFRGERLATAEGHSIQEAEMNAAASALRESEDLFPQLSHQKRIIDKTNKNVK